MCEKSKHCWENILCCLVCLLAKIIKPSLTQSRLARTLNDVNGTPAMLTLNARCGFTCYMLIEDCDKYLLGMARDNIMLTFSSYRRKHADSISFNLPRNKLPSDLGYLSHHIYYRQKCYIQTGMAVCTDVVSLCDKNTPLHHTNKIWSYRKEVVSNLANWTHLRIWRLKRHSGIHGRVVSAIGLGLVAAQRYPGHIIRLILA